MVWPLDHTIALSKLLLLLAAIAGWDLVRRSPQRSAILKQPWLILMWCLLAWVVLHAAFLSQNGVEAWRELLGQWIPVYFAIFAGVGTGIAGMRVDAKKFGWLLLASALALPILYLLVNVVRWVQLGYLPMGYMLPGEAHDVRVGTDLKTSLTFSLEMLVPFACVRLLDHWKAVGKFTLRTVWILPLILAWAVAIVSIIKNFVLLLILSMLLTLLVQGFRSGILNTRRVLLGMLGMIMLGVVAVNGSVVIHKDWQRAVSDTRIALDIDHYQNWKNSGKFGLPQNEFGETLSETYYLRLAFAHAGLRDALENPWGYGVARKAMERIEQKKDPEVSLAHAHNGYLNMSCAVGFPALTLFALVMAAVFWQLRKSSSKWAMPAIWMTGFYLLHWAIDAIERDHFFQMFIYVMALMLTLSVMDNRKHEEFRS